MKAICELTVEDPHVRKTLYECKETHWHHDLEEMIRNLKSDPGQDKDVFRLASRALQVIDAENDKVHDLWSKVIAEPVSASVMQRLSELKGSVVSYSGVLAELANSLRYVVFNKYFGPLM